MGRRKKGAKVNGLYKGGSEKRPVRGKTGGKAWFGGLACSELAGYRASGAWGNACVQHFLPPLFL